MEVFLVVLLSLLFILFIFTIVSRTEQKKLKKSISQLTEELHLSENTVNDLKEKYSPITDIEKHTQQLINDTNEFILEAKENSKNEILKVHNELEQKIIESKVEQEDLLYDAKEFNSQARQRVTESKEKAETIENTARNEAKRIIEFAKKNAIEIAGDAYEAKQKADSYETTIQAMRNTIDGYKDDYIVPNHSVLDDLAEDYSHKEAGKSLKEARATVRALIKKGHAGNCDYVEQHRKTYAIHFVVDAFNGKVDSVLAKVKHDNYGKLEQQINDAFALVNHNGQPFRNARITQEFLDIRLTELKWAVATFELRKIEQAEQAEIKAQIREEERVIREIEKARIAAEKEERLIQKTLAKVRKELAIASEEQKQQYEDQLAELEGKLIEAEEKGQRALSMAQQTRRGHVYVISNVGSFGEEIFKVGMTRRLEPLDRVKELGDASVPFSFDVHAMIYSEDAPTLEKALHNQFKDVAVNKINPRKEFFKTSLSTIKKTVEEHGINNIHWTMKAEATQYRESLSIDRFQQNQKVSA